jgi:hypothetical protein
MSLHFFATRSRRASKLLSIIHGLRKPVSKLRGRCSDLQLNAQLDGTNEIACLASEATRLYGTVSYALEHVFKPVAF